MRRCALSKIYRVVSSTRGRTAWWATRAARRRSSTKRCSSASRFSGSGTCRRGRPAGWLG